MSYRKSVKWSVRRRNLKEAREKSKMPPLLVLAELFLLVMMGVYIFRLTGLCLDNVAYHTVEPEYKDLFLVGMNMFFLITTFNAIIGIPSHKVKSWRKVVTSCVTFTIATWVSYLLADMGTYSSLFLFNPTYTTIVLTVLVVILIASRSIRVFYTPATMVTPAISAWCLYLLYIDVFDIDVQ